MMPNMALGQMQQPQPGGAAMPADPAGAAFAPDMNDPALDERRRKAMADMLRTIGGGAGVGLAAGGALGGGSPMTGLIGAGLGAGAGYLANQYLKPDGSA